MHVYRYEAQKTTYESHFSPLPHWFQGSNSGCQCSVSAAPAPERPHQAKQFHVRFIERGKGQGGNGKRRGVTERERERSSSYIYMDGNMVTGKLGR